MLDSRILPNTKMRWASSSTKMLKKPGFPFDVTQCGEFIEPRVKPGMTKIGLCVGLTITTQPLTGGNYGEGVQISLTSNYNSKGVRLS
jgi:hypothetical protein